MAYLMRRGAQTERGSRQAADRLMTGQSMAWGDASAKGTHASEISCTAPTPGQRLPQAGKSVGAL